MQHPVKRVEASGLAVVVAGVFGLNIIAAISGSAATAIASAIILVAAGCFVVGMLRRR
jgi:uncharacterized membrane protein YuzA (DUF378 family)